jgi:hypothetical protein
MRSDIEMKATEGGLSQRINELGDKATQLLTFLSFAIVSAVLLETAQSPGLTPCQRGAIKWAMRFWVMALFPILINVEGYVEGRHSARRPLRIRLLLQ